MKYIVCTLVLFSLCNIDASYNDLKRNEATFVNRAATIGRTQVDTQNFWNGVHSRLSHIPKIVFSKSDFKEDIGQQIIPESEYENLSPRTKQLCIEHNYKILMSHHNNK